MSKPVQKASIGMDIIYICQTCKNREKEYALKSRHSKHCTKCGNLSIKSTLVESYNYLTSSIVPPSKQYTASDEEEEYDFD